MYSNNIYLSIKCIYTGLVKNVYKVTIFNRVVACSPQVPQILNLSTRQKTTMRVGLVQSEPHHHLIEN